MTPQNLIDAWEQYKRACFGNRQLSPIQHRELQQAFLSGMHWLNGQRLGDQELEWALRVRLTDIRSLPQEGRP